MSRLHHFPPSVARAILQNAVDRRMPIGVFEITERSVFAILSALLVPLSVLLFTPLVRPFKWSRLVLTYVVSVASIVVFWDGIVSHWRSCTVGELQQLTEALSGEAYTWEIGTDRMSSVTVTYLLGYPTSVKL